MQHPLKKIKSNSQGPFALRALMPLVLGQGFGSWGMPVWSV
jgi:hypothetical protein